MLKPHALAAALVLASACLAQAQVGTTTTTTTAPDGSVTEIRRVSQLIGSNVHLQGSNNYGKVEDVVLDNNGAVSYLVVANRGRYAMLPYNAATVNYGQRVVNYNVAPQAIQPLFFAPNAWPNMSDQQFTTRTRRVFPNTRVIRRETLVPVEGAVPAVAPAAPVVVEPAPVVVPGAVPVVPVGPEVVREKVKIKRNGDVKIRERVR